MKQNEIVLELGLGVPLKDAAKKAIDLAKDKKSPITFKYNKVEIKVSPDTKTEYVINAFFSQAASLPNMGMQQKTINK